MRSPYMEIVIGLGIFGAGIGFATIANNPSQPAQQSVVPQCRVITSGTAPTYAAIVQALVSRGATPEDAMRRADKAIGCRP